MFEFNSMFDFISSIFSVSSILIFLFIFFIVIKGISHQQDISKKIDEKECLVFNPVINSQIERFKNIENTRKFFSF